MSYNVPPPSSRPVWPIVLACLVLVVGIAVAAVFVGINLGEDDDTASGSVSVSASGDGESDEPAAGPPSTVETVTETPKDEQPEKSAEPRETQRPPKAVDVPSEVDCGGDTAVLGTRTPTFAAAICRTGPGTYVYRGKSDGVADGIVLQAQRNAAGDWFATNKGYAYIIDADTGRLTIRNGASEVVDSENAIQFSTR
ncbi:hypothetical protein [Solicola gregarius]|uniref:Uncharacterized protein n=1 Tax=Solicola gregarius TaxID=2908642 RepID=A0AA46YJU5_9ACTN|nr:hypothetical protein [Solicola gregarius]UYM03866.1 hypothetical protein L0C25_15100 [Solicola gregarius]